MTVRRGGRWLYALLAFSFLAAVVYQVYMAGAAIFDDALHWHQHRTFVRFLEVTPVLMVAVAWLSGLPWSLRLMPILAVLLVGAQYGTARTDAGLIGALHPVMALVISWIALYICRQALEQASRIEART